MLYVMHVDWRWIKQRPHFIAEQLNSHFDVTVIYKYKYRRKSLQKRDYEKTRTIPIFLFPKIEYIEKYKYINDFIYSRIVRFFIRIVNPDFIYFTYPISMKCIPDHYHGKLIYDCMDNHVEFLSNKQYIDYFKGLEKETIDRCDYVFASSLHLKQVLSKRYSVNEGKINIIRNAYDGNIIHIENNTFSCNDIIKLSYIGTISSWFDFDLLIKSCEDFKNIEYHLYGPLSNVTLPEIDRIKYFGIIEHSELYSTVQDSDALVMPFIVNDIIESVDPVKMYEYINFNKNIISVFYNEISRFENYVYFYKNYDEYKKVIEIILSKREEIKYSNKERITFLSDNSWDSRTEEIMKILSIKNM